MAQSAIVARWFTGKELALAFGITLTISRLGTLFSFNTEALLAERMGFRGALWVAAALCLASLVCNWIYNLLDKHAEPLIHLPKAGSGDKIAWATCGASARPIGTPSCICVSFYSAIFPFTAPGYGFLPRQMGLAAGLRRGARLPGRRLLQHHPHVHHRAGDHVDHHHGFDVHGAVCRADWWIGSGTAPPSWCSARC